jgi:hypothetical protein
MDNERMMEPLMQEEANAAAVQEDNMKILPTLLHLREQLNVVH